MYGSRIQYVVELWLNITKGIQFTTGANGLEMAIGMFVILGQVVTQTLWP